MPGTSTTYPLEFAASETGRQKTIKKITDQVLQDACRSAAARTKALYSQYNYLNLKDTVDLAKFTLQTFPVILQRYQEQPLRILNGSQPVSATDVSADIRFGISDIETLAHQLERHFETFQMQHGHLRDWTGQCFLTSQISLTSSTLLSVLDPVERAMFKPYCDLLEEYVAIPWWQLYLTAVNHSQSTPQYQLVERILPKISDISFATHRQWSQQFSEHASDRGGLNDAKIRRSSLRDFDMFQVYLWLCVLQDSWDPIKKELVVFCSLVYQGLGIPWEMTVEGTRLLTNEILARLTAAEKIVAAPFIDTMITTIKGAA